MNKVEFSARVWLDHDGVDDLTIWVYELEPTGPGLRPASEWVREYLGGYDREWYAAKFGLGEGCYQIIF